MVSSKINEPSEYCINDQTAECKAGAAQKVWAAPASLISLS